jgi:cellulose synthase/poly-beta-1,6-N-acetylglucosamine synthase-like glycosyltransferase
MIAHLLQWCALVALVYFAVVNGVSLLFTVIAAVELKGHRRRRAFAAENDVLASPLTPPISVLVPAFNEESGIVDSVRSLLSLRYPEHEVIVISDGSTDRTIERLTDAFDLVPVPKALRSTLQTAAVGVTYTSRRQSELWVIDKENGGKADALNCGVNAARYPYVCAVDADALLEEDALLRVARPILDDPELVAATGGIVRIANGSRVDHGRVITPGVARGVLGTFQTIEYLRAFLIGRIGWSRLGTLMIISGAFGLFRRSLVETVGGWNTKTVGEDVELVVRLHRYLRERGEDYRIEFVPDPLCWTEAPEDLRTLGWQRRRWQRGLAEALWAHRGVLARPRYGALGLVAFPYFFVFELLGPVIELLSFPLVGAGFAIGAVSTDLLLGFVAMSVLLGILVSLSALVLEEINTRRPLSSRATARLVRFALIEDLGYRQLNMCWRLLAFLDLALRRRKWGEHRRRGFVARDEATASRRRLKRRFGSAV